MSVRAGAVCRGAVEVGWSTEVIFWRVFHRVIVLYTHVLRTHDSGSHKVTRLD